jgi:riboflavin biosynthesis pyrimidine reductase
VSDDAAAPPPPRLRSLIPPPRERGETITAEQALAGWREQERGSSPRVALNMVASLDGRIAVDGRSAPLSSPADRALFHELRAQADAVMAGARTMRLERYGPIIAKEATRARRVRQGLTEQPLAVIASRSLDLDPQLPLLADPDSRVVILTSSSRDLPACAAELDYVRAPTLRAGLTELAERHGVATIICEGGPTLNGSLAAEGLIDELFLARAPVVVGDGAGGASLLRGHALPEPQSFELRMLLECDGQLYGRYVSGAAARSSEPL